MLRYENLIVHNINVVYVNKIRRTIDIFNLVKILNPSVGRTRNIREIALPLRRNFSIIFYVLSGQYFSYSLTQLSLSLFQFPSVSIRKLEVDLLLSRPSVITETFTGARPIPWNWELCTMRALSDTKHWCRCSLFISTHNTVLLGVTCIPLMCLLPLIEKGGSLTDGVKRSGRFTWQLSDWKTQKRSSRKWDRTEFLRKFRNPSILTTFSLLIKHNFLINYFLYVQVIFQFFIQHRDHL